MHQSKLGLSKPKSALLGLTMTFIALAYLQVNSEEQHSQFFGKSTSLKPQVLSDQQIREQDKSELEKN